MSAHTAQLISDLGFSLDETPQRPRPVTLIEGVDDALAAGYRAHAAMILAGWRWNEPWRDKWLRRIRELAQSFARALYGSFG